MDLKIDGEDVTQETVPSINGDALIAFDASQTDVFFKNAVAIATTCWASLTKERMTSGPRIPMRWTRHYFDSETKEITIAFHAGNKANNLEHDIENNDDFVLKNIRLILPDGVSLRPESYGAVTESELLSIRKITGIRMSPMIWELFHRRKRSAWATAPARWRFSM